MIDTLLKQPAGKSKVLKIMSGPFSCTLILLQNDKKQ